MQIITTAFGLNLSNAIFKVWCLNCTRRCRCKCIRGMETAIKNKGRIVLGRSWNITMVLDHLFAQFADKEPPRLSYPSEQLDPWQQQAHVRRTDCRHSVLYVCISIQGMSHVWSSIPVNQLVTYIFHHRPYVLEVARIFQHGKSEVKQKRGKQRQKRRALMALMDDFSPLSQCGLNPGPFPWLWSTRAQRPGCRLLTGG